MSASMLEFTLPPELEARQPAEVRGTGRDDVRLMVSDRTTGEIVHTEFRDLPRFLRAGDLLGQSIMVRRQESAVQRARRRGRRGRRRLPALLRNCLRYLTLDVGFQTSPLARRRSV